MIVTQVRHDIDAGILPQNRRAARTWGAGGAGYERISHQIADAIDHCVDRLDPQPGEQVLDIGTGTGLTARRLAARGARVTGIDFGKEVIDAARELSPFGKIRYQVADAEALPFADGQFDAVVSTFGVMFCGNPERAAAELARVCRPSGRVALTTWLPRGGVFEMFGVIQAYRPPSSVSPPSPFAWGRTERIVELLEDGFDLGFEEATSYYREPDGAAAWEAFAGGYGPVVTLLGTLDEETLACFRAEFESFHERHRTGAGILVARPYLVTVGRRR